jgi:hypothetical protein
MDKGNKANNVIGKIYTKAELAKFFKCDPTTIDRMRKRGKLRARKLGSTVFFTEGDVCDFIDSCIETNTPIKDESFQTEKHKPKSAQMEESKQHPMPIHDYLASRMRMGLSPKMDCPICGSSKTICDPMAKEKYMLALYCPNCRAGLSPDGTPAPGYDMICKMGALNKAVPKTKIRK